MSDEADEKKIRALCEAVRLLADALDAVRCPPDDECTNAYGYGVDPRCRIHRLSNAARMALP